MMPSLLRDRLNPFVSSEVETQGNMAPSPMGISTSLDANGEGSAV